MSRFESSLAEQSAIWVLKAFFMGVKTLFVLAALTVGALVAGQSSVAPVSVHLLTSYGMEYAAATFNRTVIGSRNHI